MAKQEELRRNITDQIVESLKSGGVPPWRRPWGISPNSGFPTNTVSRKRYSGVNVLLLRMAAMAHDFRSKYWATYTQWKELGGQVMRRPDSIKPGHWGQSIVFFTRVTKTETDPVTGDEEETSFPILKTYCVFNVDQVEGDHLDYLRVKEESLAVNTDFVDYGPAEETIIATGADIRFGGDRAYFNRPDDFIQIPPKHRFKQENEYYGTVFHELAHWTGHESRLNRDQHSRFGNRSYAEEELVAEIGSCFTLAALGVPQTDNLDNHKAYVANWLEALSKDSRFIFRAASAASKAADHILSFVPQYQPEPELVDVPF
jgi:antirestriction protein ArdC